MKDNELIEIWKGGTRSEIHPYSPAELNEIVLRQARRSIGRLYSNRLIWALNLLAIGIIIWRIVVTAGRPSFTLFYGLVLGFIFFSLLILWYSYRRLRYRPADMPVREWVAVRIAKIDKEAEFRRKYGLWTDAGALLIALFVSVIHNYLAAGEAGLSLKKLLTAILISLFVASSILFVMLGSYKRKMRRTRQELQELYDQLEEPETPSCSSNEFPEIS